MDTIPILGKIRELEQTKCIERAWAFRPRTLFDCDFPIVILRRMRLRLVDQLLPLVTKDTHLVAPWRGGLSSRP